MELYRENFRSLPIPSRKAYAYQILHVALSLYQESPKNSPGVKFGPALGGHNFYMELYRESFRNLPVPSHKA